MILTYFSRSYSQHNDRAINLWQESQWESLLDWKGLSVLIFSCCYGTYFRFYKTSTKFVSLIMRNKHDVVKYIKYLLVRIAVVPVNVCNNFPILQKNFYMLLKIIWHTGWRNVLDNEVYKYVHHRTKIYTDKNNPLSTFSIMLLDIKQNKRLLYDTFKKHKCPHNFVI